MSWQTGIIGKSIKGPSFLPTIGPFIGYAQLASMLVQVEKMPDGIPLIYDRDWLPDGELFLPFVEKCGYTYCYKGTDFEFKFCRRCKADPLP